MKLYRATLPALLGVSACILGLTCDRSFASVPLVDFSTGGSDTGWRVLMGGFIETDSITDSTRSFNENIGNAPVARPSTLSGESGREQFSIRNSRLGFDIQAPEKDGWKTRAYFELDLLGYDPAPTSQSEAGFFNNPTLRVRHAYLEGAKNGWKLLAGQTWALLGWQPYYFMPTLDIQPIPGMLYSRTAQLHAIKSADLDGLGGEQHLQGSLGAMRPPQRDAGLPAVEGGVRWSYDGWKGGFVGGSTPPQQTQPLSVGISGTLRDFEVPSNPFAATGAMTHYLGRALALDALVPVIPSHDGKDVSNTFIVGGELTIGAGDGDEFGSWTGNLANPLNSLASAPNSNVGLDAGIGGFDGNGGFQLVDLRTANLYGQYHLPSSTRTWFSGGYSWLYSDNVSELTGSSASPTTVLYDKEQAAFANVMRDMTDNIRLGFEYVFVTTTYADGTLANDNRYQFSAFFIF